MAILWQRQVLGRTYEVRGAGQTRRLYTDGVFHSQYNPNHPVTGSIWDLLLLPAFFYPRGKIKNILVLGVGGGAVIQQFQYFLKPENIIGIELNPNHLYVAKKYFGVKGDNVSLIQADAIKWVNSNRDKKFDLIVDDLFGEKDGEPVRAIEANVSWFNSLSSMLKKDGCLVSNFVSSGELKQCAYFKNNSVRQNFMSVFKLGSPGYENAIGAFFKISASAQVLKKNLIGTPKLNPTLKTSRLNFNVQRL